MGGVPARAPAPGLLRRLGRGRSPRPRGRRAARNTEVLEYRPYEDGYLQVELRRYVCRDGSTRECGPYWYFQYREGGKRKKLYLGKTNDPEGTLAAKGANHSER
jgi:hypothetical protein